MAKNICDIQEDEILSIEVQNYPCLFDKANSGYKEKDRKKNAWREIDKELGYEEGNNTILHIVFLLITGS